MNLQERNTARLLPWALRGVTAEQIEPLWSRGVKTVRIAAALGCSSQAVLKLAKRLDLPNRPATGARAKKCPDGLFRRMWEFGLPTAVIAAACGYAHPRNVQRRRLDMGLEPRAPGRSSEIRKNPPTLGQFREQELALRMKEDDT